MRRRAQGPLAPGRRRVADAGAELAAVEPEGSEEQDAQKNFECKVLKTAELDLRAEDLRAAAALREVRGQRSGLGELPNREFSLRRRGALRTIIGVRAALDGLRRMGEEVTADSVSGKGVTEEFVGMQSRERNVRSSCKAEALKRYDRAKGLEQERDCNRTRLRWVARTGPRRRCRGVEAVGPASESRFKPINRVMPP